MQHLRPLLLGRDGNRSQFGGGERPAQSIQGVGVLQSKLGVLQRIMRERNHGRIQLFAGKAFGLKVAAQCGIRSRFPLVDFIDPGGQGLRGA